MPRTRLRDHNAWDLALTAVTLSATAVAAGIEVGRRVAGRRRAPRSGGGSGRDGKWTSP